MSNWTYGARGPERFPVPVCRLGRATGKVLLQPMRAKSEAKEALHAYLALICAQCRGIEMNLFLSFKDIKVPCLSIDSSDRGGEFTTT